MSSRESKLTSVSLYKLPLYSIAARILVGRIKGTTRQRYRKHTIVKIESLVTVQASIRPDEGHSQQKPFHKADSMRATNGFTFASGAGTIHHSFDRTHKRVPSLDSPMLALKRVHCVAAIHSPREMHMALSG